MVIGCWMLDKYRAGLDLQSSSTSSQQFFSFRFCFGELFVCSVLFCSVLFCSVLLNCWTVGLLIDTPLTTPLHYTTLYLYYTLYYGYGLNIYIYTEMKNIKSRR